MQKENFQIRKKTLYHLASREYSSFELTQKLLKVGFDEAEIEKEIKALKDENMLSDERFCEMFVRSKKSAGFGPIKIAFELANHQLNQTMIDNFLEKGSELWADLATEVRIKKFGESIPTDWKEKAKQMRFLQSRGFSHREINHAFQCTSDSLDF